MRRLALTAFAVAAGSSVVCGAPRAARADVTTWLAFGAGLAVDHATAPHSAVNLNPAFSASMGVGSDPTHAVVVGGVFRTMSRFNEGTDLNLSLRVTSGSYARGDWGVGFDLGPGLRLWQNNALGTFPLQGGVIFGAPWGFQAVIGADILNLEVHPASIGGYALIEFDLFRFTLMRQGSTDKYWKVPNPAGGRVEPGPVNDDR